MIGSGGMKYTCIIFDMDGTLLDTKHALNVAIDRLRDSFDLSKPISSTLFMNEWGGDVLGKIIDYIVKYNNFPIESQKVLDKLESIYVEGFWKAHVQPFEGIKLLLIELKKQGFTLGVLSNSPNDTVIKMINMFFPNIFDIVRGAHSEYQKPNSIAMEQITKGLGVSHDNVLLIGDTTVDYETTINSNVSFLAALWDTTEKTKELANMKQVISINKPEDVLEFLTESNVYFE